MAAPRTQYERMAAEPEPQDCPAHHGGMAGNWLCERPRGHEGWPRDTHPSGRAGSGAV